MTNCWNRIIYRLWAPVYDLFFAHRGFAQARRLALARLAVQPGERVILPGVGTGADLPNLPGAPWLWAWTIQPAMLAQAQRKLAAVAVTVYLIQGDVQQMPLASGAFDAAALNLILSVAPDGHACVLETWRLPAWADGASSSTSSCPGGGGLLVAPPVAEPAGYGGDRPQPAVGCAVGRERQWCGSSRRCLGACIGCLRWGGKGGLAGPWEGVGSDDGD